jgi:thiamine pyrophosphate-dependent acetolactate synthase large subunit-like protein
MVKDELCEFFARMGHFVMQMLMGLGTFPETDHLALQVCT